MTGGVSGGFERPESPIADEIVFEDDDLFGSWINKGSYQKLTATVSKNGLVVINGVIAFNATLLLNSLIATLPEKLRPTGALIHTAVHANSTGTKGIGEVSIAANGEIRHLSGHYAQVPINISYYSAPQS